MVAYKYSLEKLRGIAEEMADAAQAPFSVLLEGGIGAGKTTFSRFFIQRLASGTQITSPTFNIVQIYDTPKGSVWHVDLYRLKGDEELFQLGLIEAMHDSICLVEWFGLLKPYISDCNYTVLDLSV